MNIEPSLIWTIIAGGGLGGFVSGLIKPSNLKLTLPGGKTLPVGFLGDIVLGLAASLAVFFLLGSVFSIKLTPDAASSEVLKVIALAVISGFSGKTILNNLSNNLAGKVNDIEGKVDQIESKQKAKEYLEQGIHLADNEDYQSAIHFYELALSLRPYYSQAMCRKAMSLKRLGNISEALLLMDTLLEHNNEDSSAWYNKACYKSVLGHEKNEVILDLSKATGKNPWFKTLAKTDSDFDPIKDDPDFIAIVN